MSLTTLPNEILLRIAWFIPNCAICHCRHLTYDLSALSRCSRHLHSVLAPGLPLYSTAVHTLLWAIWHNRPDTASFALAEGADVNVRINETHYVGDLTYHVGHGTALEIAIRNRLHPDDPAARELALQICTLLLSAGATLQIDVLGSIVKGGDTDLIRCCLPYITDINERTDTSGATVLSVADSYGQMEVAAVLRAAGASMEGTGHDHVTRWAHVGVCRMAPMDGRPDDFRIAYPGWDVSDTPGWDEWGPVCMLPDVRSGCLCPWCPRESTGGYSVMRVSGLGLGCVAGEGFM